MDRSSRTFAYRPRRPLRHSRLRLLLNLYPVLRSLLPRLNLR